MPATSAVSSLQAADDLAGGRLALGVRLEIDEEAAGIERDVGAVDADERRQAVDVDVGQDDLGELLLVIGHLIEGDRFCAAWVTPWMTPVSWIGKNPLGIVT